MSFPRPPVKGTLPFNSAGAIRGGSSRHRRHWRRWRMPCGGSDHGWAAFGGASSRYLAAAAGIVWRQLPALSGGRCLHCLAAPTVPTVGDRVGRLQRLANANGRRRAVAGGVWWKRAASGGRG